jgi:hypothetical protein
VAVAWAATALVSPGQPEALGLDSRGAPPALTRAPADAPCVISVAPGAPTVRAPGTDAEVEVGAPLSPVCLLRVRPDPGGETDYILPGGRTIRCRPEPDDHQECW